MKNIEEEVIDIIVNSLGLFHEEAENVNLKSNLEEDLGADSIDMLEISMDVEKEFGIIIPDDEISNLKTVAEWVSYVEKAITG